MKIRALIFASLLYCVCTYADNANSVVLVSADYTYVSDSRNESIAEAEYKAIERAKVKALEEKFGLDISAVSSTVQNNEFSNGDASTLSDFYSLGLSCVQGEWLETITERIDEPKYKNGFLSIKVYVKGKARAKSSESIQIENHTLRNGTTIADGSDRFVSGDKLYMQFKSPVSGYVCVYLVDEEENAYCLLPDQYNPNGHYSVEANKEYIFFSQEHTTERVDEYELTANGSVEHNQVWVIFSPQGFHKASDNHTDNNWLDMPMPRSLPYKKFMEWLAKNRLRDNEMVVKMDVIKIFRAQ